MTGLTGARCVGQGELFESTDMRDHAAASALCAECPALTACAMLLREVQTTTSGLRSSGGGPVGTWAGKLLGKKGYRSEYILPRCGTDRGYYRHRSERKAACEECLAAHAAAGRKMPRRKVVT